MANFWGDRSSSRLGSDVEAMTLRIHTSVVIVAPEHLRLGNHVRVDPFSLLSASGEISLGNHIHIGSHCTLIGASAIRVEDFAGISHGARLFSASDDFGGGCLTGPTVPDQLRNVISAPIYLRAACRGRKRCGRAARSDHGRRRYSRRLVIASFRSSRLADLVGRPSALPSRSPRENSCGWKKRLPALRQRAVHDPGRRESINSRRALCATLFV